MMLRVREYGETGPLVVVLHGGPAAPGEMAPVARGLADRFRVLEPLQRGSGPEPLSVARHVEDLHELIVSRRVGSPPAVVGFSWGAMLALAHGAAHPDDAGCLVLVGCGTFDTPSRERMRAILEERTDDALRARLVHLPEAFPDPDARMMAHHAATLPTYSHDLLATNTEAVSVDARAYRETWDDALRLQREGAHPAAFAAITSPVLMLHGAEDPHPGRMILDSLAPHIRRLEYRELAQCGHYPWLERAAREAFFSCVREWLDTHLASPVPPGIAPEGA
jgi:pimeloyl-ACP methyl ester carboxylesterase